jgi:basic amino acid/polyamine antiporter, APA family
VKGGSKTVVYVIVFSLLLITVIYLLVNWALISGLGMQQLASSKAAPADLLGLAFGPIGEKLLGLFVAVAALTSINATMIVGARTNFAMGEDWYGLRFMGAGKPSAARLVWLTLFKGVLALRWYVLAPCSPMVLRPWWNLQLRYFGSFLFLVGISVFILRFKHPNTNGSLVSRSTL